MPPEDFGLNDDKPQKDNNDILADIAPAHQDILRAIINIEERLNKDGMKAEVIPITDKNLSEYDSEKLSAKEKWPYAFTFEAKYESKVAIFDFIVRENKPPKLDGSPQDRFKDGLTNTFKLTLKGANLYQQLGMSGVKIPPNFSVFKNDLTKVNYSNITFSEEQNKLMKLIKEGTGNSKNKAQKQINALRCKGPRGLR